MKTTVHVLLFGLLFLPIISCKCKKNAATTSSTTTTQQTTTASASQKDETIRFEVMFASKGGGIDGKMRDEFINFVQTYPKKPAYTTKHWGREGETDYYFTLNELSPSEQTEFITKANALISKSELVHAKENTKPDHTNWPDPTATKTAEDSCRFLASFYSKGEGVDAKAWEEFKIFLDNYPKKLVFEAVARGREGEGDYCFKLKELTPAEQKDFVKKATELLSKSQLVHVYENQPFVHKH